MYQTAIRETLARTGYLGTDPRQVEAFMTATSRTRPTTRNRGTRTPRAADAWGADGSLGDHGDVARHPRLIGNLPVPRRDDKRWKRELR